MQQEEKLLVMSEKILQRYSVAHSEAMSKAVSSRESIGGILQETEE